jgi:hypothetical protein
MRLPAATAAAAALLAHCLASASAAPAASLSASWDYLGPFPVAKTELDGDPAAAIAALHDVRRRKARLQQPLLSELVPGGNVSWTTLRADAGGAVTVSAPPAVDWNALVQRLSDMAVLETQGWAVAALRVSAAAKGAARVRVRLRCEGAVAAFLASAPDGEAAAEGTAAAAAAAAASATAPLVQLSGDIYGTGWISSMFSLAPSDQHRLFVFVRAKANARFACHATAVAAAAPALEARSVLVAPDALEGHGALGDVLGVVIVSSAAEWLDGLRCAAAPARASAAAARAAAESAAGPPAFAARIAPGGVLVLPCRLALAAEALAACVAGVALPLSVRVWGRRRGAAAEEASAPLPHSLRCRGRGQSAVMTFVDHDGSAASAALVLPLPRAWAPAPARGFPVLLSLHGTGVSGSGQADAYKTKLEPAQPDYEFGVAGFYVLAPDRFGAHNWQGVGSWSAFAALRALGALASSSRALPRADTSRVLFAGHSMGGAGAWFAVLAAPDLAIAAAPAAGWLVKEHYADANRAFGFDSSEPLAQPRLAAALLAAVRDQRADAFAGALVGVPTHVRVGADDATVPPFFSRRMVRLLRAANAGSAPRPGPGLVLEEVPAKDHWCAPLISPLYPLAPLPLRLALTTICHVLALAPAPPARPRAPLFSFSGGGTQPTITTAAR